MNDKECIMKDIRKRFDEWKRTKYHNRTITGDELMWAAWQAAILSDREDKLADLEPGDYQDVSPKHWMKKEVSALKASLTGN